MDRVEYDEFGLFHENADEFGLPFDGPPLVRRAWVEVADGRRLSALVWKEEEPELVLLHGGAQNAHTWDTVAMALDRPLVAIDLPGHGHSDGPGPHPEGDLSVDGNAADVAVAIGQLAPAARAVVGMSLGGLTTIALTKQAPELVRKVVLVDVLPGIKGARAKHIVDFVNGPRSFGSLQELLELTASFNPTRSLSSLRRGILHNAEQQDDGTWVWRWARHRPPAPEGAPGGAELGDTGYEGLVGVAVVDHGAPPPRPGHAVGLRARRRGRGGVAPSPPFGTGRSRRRRRAQPARGQAPRAHRHHRGLRLRELTPVGGGTGRLRRAGGRGDQGLARMGRYSKRRVNGPGA